MTLTYSATTVTLPGALPQTPLPSIEHRQNVKEADDGTIRVYNRAVNRWYLKIGVRVKAAERDALRAFVKNTIQFSTLPFSVTPDSTVDFGKGAGVTLASVTWWENTYTEIPRAGGATYDISFVLRTKSTGTNNPA